MKVKREEIYFNPMTRRFITTVAVRIEEYNPIMAKAKAEFVGECIDNILKITEAKQAEFEEIYGLEVIKNTHHNFDEEPEIKPIRKIKHIQSREVQQKLLERIE